MSEWEKQEKKEYVLKLENAACWKSLGETGFCLLDLYLYPGERIQIVNGWGTGASQLYKVLAGEEKLWEGSLHVCGKRRVVPKIPPVLSRFTVSDMLILPGLWERKNRREAWLWSRDWLKRSILWEKRSMPIGFLSGYERCLLMLLAAFSTNPDLVVVGDCMAEMNRKERELFWKAVSECLERSKSAVIGFGEECGNWFPFDRCVEV